MKGMNLEPFVSICQRDEKRPLCMEDWLQPVSLICNVLYTLLGCVFFIPLENFHLFGDVTLISERLQISTYARHSWLLCNEGSLVSHIYCDTGHPIIMVISEDQGHSHLLSSVWQWSCHYLFKQLWTVAAGIRTPLLACQANALTDCAFAAAHTRRNRSLPKWS